MKRAWIFLREERVLQRLRSAKHGFDDIDAKLDSVPMVFGRKFWLILVEVKALY